MKLDKIILELKAIKEMGDDFTALERYNNLISTLEKALKEQCFKTKPSDKKRLNAIKRVLKEHKTRPILSCFTPYEKGKVAFTDSYQLYILNEDYLPFNVAFDSTIDDDFKDNYLKVYGGKILGKKEGVYPNLHNLIPTSEPLYKIDLKVSEVLALEKTTEKKGDGAKVYTFENENGKISLDLVCLKNCINILKLKDNFTMEIHGGIKPIIIHNDDGELGLILPIKVY